MHKLLDVFTDRCFINTYIRKQLNISVQITRKITQEGYNTEMKYMMQALNIPHCEQVTICLQSSNITFPQNVKYSLILHILN